jgi:predicted nucleic acid-binding protein
VTSGTNDRTFVDTNVLIYAHDVDAGRKHEIAKDLLRTLWADRAGILSTQVLQEFYVNATRKIRKPLTKPEARSVVDTYAPWCVDGITTSDIIAAFQIEDQARIGFWDALIIAVAARAGARRVVSEDLNAGQSIAGVSVHNPFKDTPAKPRR